MKPSIPALQWVSDSKRVIALDLIDPGLDAGNLDLDIAPERLGSILYTSSSTGEPKGVIQNHRNILHCVLRYTNGNHVSARDRISLLASTAFAASVPDIFGALLNGARLLPFSVREHSFTELANWLNQEDISIYHSVPTLFRHWCVT